ncbi:hypothetical protein SCFA_1150005 [anaerobic digester metagenome]|uniref:Uncharacterized protein n=1 Tax=anaerobic digester metagenome TaxID=1263854 RepID=A0A485LVN6_9ZZZZ
MGEKCLTLIGTEGRAGKKVIANFLMISTYSGVLKNI